MILLDAPYVSNSLLHRIHENRWPVVDTPEARAMGLRSDSAIVAENEAITALRRANHASQLKLYTNSENALEWVTQRLGLPELATIIDGFKNKARFRELTASLNPGYPCRSVEWTELASLDGASLSYPLILKPAVGFFSIGVRRVASANEWPATLAALRTELAGFRQVYPNSVLDTDRFVIEPYVEGREFAIDAYYDAQGEPVVLNLLEHLFSSDDDVGDRVYTTSPALVREHLETFTGFLAQMGSLVGARHIPVHVELRVTADGDVFPIEVNPLRFGGWCTTADLTEHAYGFDPYDSYLRGLRPDWDGILESREGRRSSVVVLNNSTGIEVEDIARFDHDAVAAKFSKVLELRPIDHHRYRLFGFLFVETDDRSQAELDWILHSDLKQFITPA